MSEGSVTSNMQVDPFSSYVAFSSTERSDGADAGISTDTRSPDDPNLSTSKAASRGSIHAETSADLALRLDTEAISSVRNDAFWNPSLLDDGLSTYLPSLSPSPPLPTGSWVFDVCLGLNHVRDFSTNHKFLIVSQACGLIRF